MAAENRSFRKENAELHRTNEILSTGSVSSQQNSTAQPDKDLVHRPV